MKSISSKLKIEARDLFDSATTICNPLNLKNLNHACYKEDFDKYLDAMVTGVVYSLVALSSLSYFIKN